MEPLRARLSALGVMILVLVGVFDLCVIGQWMFDKPIPFPPGWIT